MQAIIAATSSRLDNDIDTVLITVTTTIGDSVSTKRCGYSVHELEHNRYLAGTLEERIETLRVSAQNVAEHSFRAQYAAMLAPVYAQPMAQPGVIEVDQAAIDKQILEAEQHVAGESVETPVKKTRKPRTTKTPTESQE